MQPGRSPFLGLSILLALAPLANADAAEVTAPTAIAPLPAELAQLVAVSDGNGLIYVGTGFDATSALSDLVWAYDPELDTYTPVASFPNAVRGGSATLTASGEVVFVAGEPSTTLASSYDPLLDVWNAIASPPGGQYWRGQLVTDDAGVLHLLGGEGQTFSHTTYDPEMDMWTAQGDGPTSRVQHAAAHAADGNIYVIGGTDALQTMDVFDVDAGTWSAGVAPPSDVANAGVATDGQHIVIVGGSPQYLNFGSPFLDTILVYDTVEGAWTTSTATLPAATRSGAAAYVDGY